MDYTSSYLSEPRAREAAERHTFVLEGDEGGAGTRRLQQSYYSPGEWTELGLTNQITGLESLYGLYGVTMQQYVLTPLTLTVYASTQLHARPSCALS